MRHLPPSPMTPTTQTPTTPPTFTEPENLQTTISTAAEMPEDSEVISQPDLGGKNGDSALSEADACERCSTVINMENFHPRAVHFLTVKKLEFCPLFTQ